MTPAERRVARDMAREDLYFFSRYMFLERRKYRWKRAQHHKVICDALMRVFNGETKRLIINVPPRYSKAIDCNTPMWTADGWKPAGEVRIGDRLLGSNGQWTTVIGVHPQGVKPAYDVRFSDGSSLIACGDHRWSVRLRDKVDSRDWTAPWQVKTTDELIGDLREADGRKKWRIPVLKDTNTADVDVPIDPYLLGCWLGDGHTHMAAITTMDSEIVQAFAEYDPRPYTHQNGGKATTFGLRNGFVTKLRSLGVLGKKHIPDAYMRGSHAQRLALLQGIADTDGWVGAANGQQGIASSNPRLSDDIRALVNSLGGVWRGCTSYPKTGKPSYKTHITLADGDVAFRLPRKVQRIRRLAECNMPRRFVDEIVPVSAREMVCFTVDAEDSLFCAGRDFVVTHNTELAVVNFIAWALGRVPDAEFIHVSYSATLAVGNSVKVRELVQHDEFRAIFPAIELKDTQKAHWTTTAGGVVYATGSEGTITGFGAGKDRPGFGGAIIIDDPHKADEAKSEVMRGNVIDWFGTTLESRKNSADTPIILIMQRLHEEDLAGWLLAGGNGEEWEHVCLDVWQQDDEGNPAPLWPEKHGAEELRRMERANPYVFAGQYRQRPAPPEGGEFKPDNITIVDAIPAAENGKPLDIRWVRGWDFGSTTDGDPTAGGKLGLLPDGRLIIADMVHDFVGPDTRDAMLVNTAISDTSRVRISIPQDPGQAGKTQVMYLTRKLAGFSVHSSPESGDKVTRAEPFASQVNVGNVMMLRGPWNKALIDEMRLFPFGKYDDRIDCLSRAYSELLARPAPAEVEELEL